MANASQAVALLSSGLDSSVALALEKEAGTDIVLALTFDYGHRAARREVEQAARIAKHFGVPHRTIVLPWFRELARGGNLLDPQSELPKPSLSDLSNKNFVSDSQKAVWIPNRNGVFLEIAACFAEDRHADSVIVGFNSEEAQTFPDNSIEYQGALTEALFYSTSNHVRVTSPTAQMTKLQIVKEAKRINFPFAFLWSCYEAGQQMCGRCESCMRLKRALLENEVSLDDPFEDPRI